MTDIDCQKCTHSDSDHRDNICYGDRFCLCMVFESPVVAVVITPLYNESKTTEQSVIRSRTDIPLPMHITTHDNWKGNGWDYQVKWNKTQIEMVEFLSNRCGLFPYEIQIFLRCKSASVRGRLSEIRNRKYVFH